MEEAERLCDRVAIIEHGRVIDVDTPARLVARHCPERSVVLTTEDPRAEERFRGLAQVVAVRRDAGQFTIEGRGEGFVTEVIQCLAEHQVKVSDFRTAQPTLEDVFLKLTGHSIRD
jgi:ABC-2 type transport system ATP-binding protein